MLQAIQKALGGVSLPVKAPPSTPVVSQPQPQTQFQPSPQQKLDQWVHRLRNFGSPLTKEELPLVKILCQGKISGLEIPAQALAEIHLLTLSHLFLQDPAIAFDWGQKLQYDFNKLCDLEEQVCQQAGIPIRKRTRVGGATPTPSTSEIVKSEPVPQEMQPHAQPVEEKPIYRDEYERRGQEMAIAFQELGYEQIKFVSFSNDGPRHTRFVFKKPTKTKFNSLHTNLDDVLSHAGYNPEDLNCLFRKLKDNQFEFQIPRPREEWQSYPLLPSDAFANPQLAKKWLKQVTDKISSIDPSTRRQGVFLRFGVDMDGKGVDLDCTTGAILVGEPNSGKSTAIKALVTAFCLTHSPRQGKLLRFDFKDGLTLSLLDGLPHLWHIPGEPYPCPTISSLEQAEQVFDALDREYKQRMKVLKQEKLENVYQFNAIYPEDSMPVLFSLFEEIAGYNALAMREKGKAYVEQALQRLFSAVSLYRAAGMPFIITTQYPADRCGMPAEVRSCLGSGVCFKTSKRAADLVFGEGDNHFSKQVHSLTGMGDCIIKQHGGHIHCQGYDLPTSILKTFVSGMGQIYRNEDAFLMENIQELIG